MTCSRDSSLTHRRHWWDKLFENLSIKFQATCPRCNQPSSNIKTANSKWRNTWGSSSVGMQQRTCVKKLLSSVSPKPVFVPPGARAGVLIGGRIKENAIRAVAGTCHPGDDLMGKACKTERGSRPKSWSAASL
eukprot:1497981-Amphidinium_carterae.1